MTFFQCDSGHEKHTRLPTLPYPADIRLGTDRYLERMMSFGQRHLKILMHPTFDVQGSLNYWACLHKMHKMTDSRSSPTRI